MLTAFALNPDPTMTHGFGALVKRVADTLDVALVRKLHYSARQTGLVLKDFVCQVAQRAPPAQSHSRSPTEIVVETMSPGKGFLNEFHYKINHPLFQHTSTHR